MNTASVSIRTTNTHQLQASSWDTPDDSYTLKTIKVRFTESVVKELNEGRMSPEVNKMVDAVMWPGKNPPLTYKSKPLP